MDTAGRLHTKINLMEELKKVRRVIERQVPDAPHETLLVLDAVTGQNALIQAKTFTAAVGVTGLILAKLDGSAKGGVVFSIAQELELPIKFVGTGEKLDDLAVRPPSSSPPCSPDPPFRPRSRSQPAPPAQPAPRTQRRRAMFEALTDRLQGVFKDLRGKGQLSRGGRRRGAARGAPGPARGGRQLQAWRATSCAGSRSGR